MAYDPTKPVENTPLDAVEMRNQLAGLKDLIDALPASPEMANVISDASASNVNGVSPLNLTVSDPPTQAEMQAVVDQLNALLNALWR